ncbi:two-component system nitrogen regulation sensor histidine kinase NtrY [Sphingomonas kaistensis]|uniref:histidine kinase n=1 Tax=Sphingomonas kaistensis TaxID=298708 RepID=A0A7X6BHK3_9SPHN|nr:ATP-binding protein [Sphingomonas kaistensis]NJC06201.1 two-component system nitrogen regulation sensor histidine kinase NtrY [Sphingomonas kaistensis]
MDARSAASTLDQPPSLKRWLASERANGRFYRVMELVATAALIAMLAISYAALSSGDPTQMVSPPLIALLLVGNLIPAILLMVLLTRHLAVRRAAQGGLGTGRLHTRLVALFSIIAAVPTVLVAIFASFLLQFGLEFWFSNRAQTVLTQAQSTAAIYEREHRERLRSDMEAMGVDVVRGLNAFGPTSTDFQTVLYQQVAYRQLREAALFTLSDRGEWITYAVVNFDNRPIEQRFTPNEGRGLKAGQVSIKIGKADRIEGLIRLDPDEPVFLYGAREINAAAVGAVRQASQAAEGYRRTLERARALQLRFNAALLLGALVIVGLAIFVALRLADRLVRPLGGLVSAAGRVEEGDFSARVEVNRKDDELGVLAAAFNRMTGRLEEQTGALKAVNTQLDTRRAFIEAVLGSVTAGVIALDDDRRILLTNRSAEALLQQGAEGIEDRTLHEVSHELEEFLCGDQREADVLVRAEGGQRTLAVKRVRYADGWVLTFDDITEQLADQRRAAWSDIARRIAHEIKNPLTPIQLAAERIQRRFGKEVQSDPETFSRLTETIVRQVGDLRRMVDEFSNFARMPKPKFREENVHDIARTSLFLHEVAHPGITFTLVPPQGDIRMVCDRGQLGQALTNVVKNAVEAIESRRNRGEHSLEGDRVTLRLSKDSRQLVMDLNDTGIGLPQDRERLTEPYMTTRVRGTGLGLAIVKKIVEEHGGEIAFLDRAGGGTHVRIAFDLARLALLAEAAEQPQDEESA